MRLAAKIVTLTLIGGGGGGGRGGGDDGLIGDGLTGDGDGDGDGLSGGVSISLDTTIGLCRIFVQFALLHVTTKTS